jgi:3D (Asp-Asp-Asp) domain-containing protein
MIIAVLGTLQFTGLSGQDAKTIKPGTDPQKAVKAKTVIETVPRPFKTVVKKGAGRTLYVKQTGRDGHEEWLTLKITDSRGRVAKLPLMRTKAAPARDMVILTPKKLSSRHAVVRPGVQIKPRVYTMVATAYPRHGAGLSPTTFMGMRTGKGVAAVDPRIIPLGSRLYIEGYGEAIAADTGGTIRGMRIDLGFETVAECKRFGRRKVKVTVLPTG